MKSQSHAIKSNGPAIRPYSGDPDPYAYGVNLADKVPERPGGAVRSVRFTPESGHAVQLAMFALCQ